MGRTETAEPSGGGARRDWQRWLCVQRHARGERGGRRGGGRGWRPFSRAWSLRRPRTVPRSCGETEAGTEGAALGGSGGGNGDTETRGGIPAPHPHSATEGPEMHTRPDSPAPPRPLCGVRVRRCRGAPCRWRSSVRGGARAALPPGCVRGTGSGAVLHCASKGHTAVAPLPAPRPRAAPLPSPPARTAPLRRPPMCGPAVSPRARGAAGRGGL